MKLIVEWPLLMADAKPDATAIAQAARRAHRAGAQRVLICGPAGEYANMTLEQQGEYVKAVWQALQDQQIGLILAVQETATARCIERIKDYSQVPEIQFACPIHYHFGMSHPDEITRHFKALAQAAPNGLYALDYPALTNYALCKEDLQGLSFIAGVLGVLRVGRGVAAPTYCLEPDLSLPIWLSDGASRLASRFDRISQLAFLFTDLPDSAVDAGLALIETGVHPAAALKYAGHALGLCSDPNPLPPYDGLSQVQREHIDHLLKEIKGKGGKV